MTAISDIPGETDRLPEPYLLRPHGPGDMGGVGSRHAARYAEAYEWGATFEALAAGIVAGFRRGFDPARQRCWMAERHGANVGALFLMKHPERARVAKLRPLLVEPSARGLAIGAAGSSNAPALPARPATRPSPSGSTTSSTPPASSTRPPAIASSTRRPHGFGHDLWSRRGSWRGVTG